MFEKFGLNSQWPWNCDSAVSYALGDNRKGKSHKTYRKRSQIIKKAAHVTYKEAKLKVTVFVLKSNKVKFLKHRLGRTESAN